MAPTKSIRPRAIEGHKKQKQRMIFLVCTNPDSSEKFSLLMIGKSQQPHVPGNRAAVELGFDYHLNKKAWMNSKISSIGILNWTIKLANFMVEKSSYFSTMHPCMETLAIIQSWKKWT